MTETTVTAGSAARFTTTVSRGLRESAVIALALLALVLFVALASYSPDDTGFSYTGNAVRVHNRIGVVGAWLADVLFFLFGWPAYLFPLTLGAACWGLQHRLQSPGASRANRLVRLGGFLLLLIARIAEELGRELDARQESAVAELEAALNRLISAGLLSRQGVPPYATYIFKHALVQEAAYSTLLREHRRALHAKIAQALETRFSDVVERQPGLLARHCTDAGQIEKAVGLWTKAGQRSLERG